MDFDQVAVNGVNSNGKSVTDNKKSNRKSDKARETYYGKNSNDDTVGRDGWR